jgi:polyvinyl alcohol dehydrogenase (cytochrome)
MRSSVPLVTAIPGVAFSGGVSGFLRAYATDSGRLLWEFDTARDYATLCFERQRN